MKTQVFCSMVLSGVLIATAYAGDAADYLQIKETEVEVKAEGGKKTLELEIETKGNIPMDGKSGAFGYAALSDGGNNLLVVVTHLPIDDSSYEKAPSGFHTHVLDLKEPTQACSGANFEVDLENSGKNKAFDADYAWTVKKDKLKVKDVPVSDLGDAGVEAVVSFTLKPVLNKQGKPSNLCVHVANQS